jgi:hypothetical protein
MVLNSYITRFSLIIVITITLWLLLKRSFKCEESKIRSVVSIHRKLNSLSNECRHKNFEQAQNTYLDLHLDWQRVELTNEGICLLAGFPSDSLTVLGLLVDSAARSTQDRVYTEQIRLEIKRITTKLTP